jgi:hypothetical protein
LTGVGAGIAGDEIAEPYRAGGEIALDAAGTARPGRAPTVRIGPHLPGAHLALLEMKTVIATIYQNFDVERVGAASDVREELSFTMMPVGLKVKLQSRAP